MKKVESNLDALKLLEELRALDGAAIIDRVTSNPEYVEKLEKLKSEADAERDQALKQAARTVMFFDRAKKHGAIPLDALLMILAGAQLSQALRTSKKRDAILAVDMEYFDSYRILLHYAKRDIRSGELKVRQLLTSAFLNDLPVIQAWCNTNDSLKGIDEMRPDSRLVVKIEDAGQWLAKIGMPVPGWLRADSEPVAENIQAAPVENLSESIPAAENEDGKDVPIGDLIRKRHEEMKRKNFRPMIKTLMREFDREESCVKKHLYGPAAKKKGAKK